MKKIKKSLSIILFLVFTSLTISCSKSDASVPNNYSEENFLSAFLETTNFKQQVTSDNLSSYYLFGIAFKPKVNGTINTVNIKLPTSDGGVIVKVWKVSTQALIKTIPIIVPTNNLEVVLPIDKISLLKDEEYLIVMQVNSVFRRSKTDNTSISFPVEIGNIKITGLTNTSNINNVYPNISDNLVTNKYFGDLSFNFQQTE